MALKVEELQVLISANADQFKNELIGINRKLEGLNKVTSKTSNTIGSTFTKSIITAQIATNIFNKALGFFEQSISDSIGATQKFESALIGLETVAGRKLGQEAIPLATQAAKDLASDGLMSVTDAALGLKNLLASNFSLDQAINLMNVFKNSAAFGRQSALGFGESIASATEGIKNGNSILVDNAGITKNLSQILVEAGYSQNDLNRATQDAGVRQALYNGLLREGNLFQGDAAKLANTSAGQVAALGVTLTNLKVTVGQIIKPIQSVITTALSAFFGGLQTTINGAQVSIQNFANKVAGYMLAVVRVIGTLLSRLPFIGKGFAALANLTLRTSSAQQDLGGSLDSTADSLDNATSSSDKLKKSLLGLAAFDEMNVLTQDAGSAGAGSPTPTTSFAGGGVGAGSPIDGASINAEADKAMEGINKLKDSVEDFLKPLREITIFGTPLVDLLGEIAKYAGIAFLAFKILGPIVGLVGAAIGAVTSPVTLTILAIAGLIAIFKLAYDNSESFRNTIDQLVVLIRDGLVAAWNLLGEAVNWAWINVIQPAILWFQENIVPTLIEIGQKVQEMVAVFVEKLPEIIAAVQPLVDSIGNFLSGAFKLLGTIVDWLWKNILKPFVDFILANIVPAFKFVLDIVGEVIKIFVAIATPIIDLIIPVLTQLWDTFTKVFDGVKKIVEDVWNNILKPIFTALWDFVSGFIIPIFQLFQKITEIVFNKVRSVVEEVWGKIMEAIRPVVDWINTNIVPVVEKVRKGFEDAFNGIKTTVENIWNGIGQTIKGGINWIIDRVNEFIRGINGMLRSLDDAAGTLGINVDFRVGEIPRLATGGIAVGSTIANIGEAGDELILPLENNTGWMDTLAEKIGGGMGHITIKIGENTILDTIIDGINDKGLRSNDLVINA